MNYIKHVNAIFNRFAADTRLNPTHVSLYMALFQFWNLSHFSTVIYINREEVMKISKIGSMSTYHRCLRQLHKWDYIIYLPTHNPFKSSQIKFVKFGTTSGNSSGESDEDSSEKVVDIASVSKTKQLKQIENQLNKPVSKQEVIDFFIEKEWAVLEAEKFYNHYEGVGWKLGGKVEIQNWKAVAENWVLRADESEIRSFVRKGGSGAEYLKTKKVKDYAKPL